MGEKIYTCKKLRDCEPPPRIFIFKPGGIVLLEWDSFWGSNSVYNHRGLVGEIKNALRWCNGIPVKEPIIKVHEELYGATRPS